MPLTPDEQSQGYLSFQNEAVNPAGTANGQAGTVVRRYTAPTTGQQMNPGTTDNTSTDNTPVANPSANPVANTYLNNPIKAPTPQDEATIRSSIANTMQSSVDAINSQYNAMQQSQINPQLANNSGQTRAINARSGLMDSDFGAANTQTTEQHNQAIQDAFNAERQTKLNDITNQVNTRAEAEIAARKEAAITNSNNYAQYLQKAQEEARSNVKDLASIGAVLDPQMKASLVKDSGYDPMTFDAIFNANKEHSMQAQYEYTNLGNGTVLRTGKLANGQAVPNQTFQYQLGPNDQFEMSQNGTPLIITKNGNDITSVKIAPGFQSGDLASKFTPVYSNGNVSLLNTLTGKLSDGSGSPGGGNGFSGSGGSGGSLVSSNPNPNAVVNGYDLTSYASGNKVGGPASQAHNVSTTYSKLSPVTDAQSANAAIQSIKAGSPVTGDMVMQAAQATGVDPKMIISVMNAESQLGTDGSKGSREFNYGNVGNTDSLMASGGSKGFASPLEGVMAVAKNLAQRQVHSGNPDLSPSRPFNASTNGLDAEATARLTGEVTPKGNGKTSYTDASVKQRANQIAAQLGIVQPGEAFDATALKADQKANLKVLTDQIPQRAQLQSNLDAADSNFNMLTGFMQQHGLNASDVPLANQLQQKINSGGLQGKDAVGAQAAMNSALAGLATEYSQILARGGQRNETVDKEAAKLIPGNLSPAELQNVVNYIKSEGQNVLKSKDTAIANAQKAFKNPTASSSTGGTSGKTSSGISYTIH